MWGRDREGLAASQLRCGSPPPRLRDSSTLESVDAPSLDIAPEQDLRTSHRGTNALRPLALLFADEGVRHLGLPPPCPSPTWGDVALTFAISNDAPAFDV